MLEDLTIKKVKDGEIEKEIFPEGNLRHLSRFTKERQQLDQLAVKIKKFKRPDQLIKFCVDIIRKFDKVYLYNRGKKNNGTQRIWKNFRHNSKRFEYHAKFINQLRISPDHINIFLRDKIIHRDLHLLAD